MKVRGNQIARTNNRGLAYWSDGKCDDRVLLISPGYQLIALEAKTGRLTPTFGDGALSISPRGLIARWSNRVSSVPVHRPL